MMHFALKVSAEKWEKEQHARARYSGRRVHRAAFAAEGAIERGALGSLITCARDVQGWTLLSHTSREPGGQGADFQARQLAGRPDQPAHHHGAP
eukprot:918512-Pyramimonas_sp.AAC.1